VILRVFQKAVVIKGVNFSVTVGAKQVAFISLSQHPTPSAVANDAFIQANFFVFWVAMVELIDTGMKVFQAALAASSFEGNQLGFAILATLPPGRVIPNAFLPSFVRHGTLL
jgi:hypothetical protein